MRSSAFLIIPLLASFAWPQQPQPMTNIERGRAMEILQLVSNDVKKHYYDPKFHGVDWDAQVAQAKAKIEKETSFNMAMSHIAAALDSLHDSHTFLIPPRHAYVHDYEFRYQMVGQHCFITEVRPKSDADTKGVKAGDEIVTINGYTVDGTDFWKVQYMFDVLRPQPGLRLGLRDSAGNTRQVDVAAMMREKKRVADLTGANAGADIFDLIRQGENQMHLMRPRYSEVGNDLLILKVPEFIFSAQAADEMIGKARKYRTLILDLRGNPGGSVESLRYLLAGVFDKEVKIANRIGRKEAKPDVAKPSHDPFRGRLVVLVDSRSASAAELFARVVQLEKRGIVMGDQSSGSVMEAQHFNEKIGLDTVIFFGASVTEWDLIMSDGKSLEHVGVAPDQTILPSAQDIANGRDPVLADAATSLGVKLSSEDAGKAFPFEWPVE
jgi:carboxyl-terminal processing protease